VARLDAELAQLGHRRRGLPEHAELERLEQQRSQLAAQRVQLDTEVSDLTREQKKADADVELVRSRKVRTQQRLDTGAVSSPRELEQLQHELVSLDRRIGALEDEELEVMEQLETAQTELTRVTGELEQVQTRRTELESARDDAVGGLDGQAGTALAERQRLVAELPDPLVTLYERVRAQAGGVGAAELRRRRCEGCRLELTAADVADIAAMPKDEVLRCPECNRILVRTAESGI